MKRLSIIPNREQLTDWAHESLARVSAWFQQLGRRLADELKKYAVVGVLIGLFLLWADFWGTLAVTAGLAIPVGMVLLSIKFGAFFLWTRKRRAALLGADMSVPDRRGMWRLYKAELKRIEYLKQQWVVACTTQGLTANKQVPALREVQGTITGDVTACVSSSRMGVLVQPIINKAADIAEVVGGGCREVVVTPTASGADLSFNWSDPMGKTLHLSGLPMSKPGTIAYGIRRDGTAATIEQDKSVLIGGLTGFGKSNIIWTMLADLVRKQVPIRLYVSDPKGGIELPALGKATPGEWMGSVQVMKYVTNADDTNTMVADVERRMRYSMSKQTGRKHTPTKENPLCIVLLDELLPLHEMIAQKNKGPLGKIMFEGRAAGYVVWANAQVGHASVLDILRNFIPQRICVKTNSADVTDTILGKGAEARGAKCSLIAAKDKGVGFSEADSSIRPEPFRAPLVRDSEAQRTAVGAVAAGMPTEMPKPVESKAPEQLVYFIEARGTDLVKIGIAAKPENRLGELQTASPHKLAILATMPGGKPVESRLHRHFGASRATGEWFHRTPELDALIADAQAGKPGPQGPNPMQQVRKAQTATRDWVMRNARSITVKRPQPSQTEAAAVPAAYRASGYFNGTDYHGGHTAAVWGE